MAFYFICLFSLSVTPLPPLPPPLSLSLSLGNVRYSFIAISPRFYYDPVFYILLGSHLWVIYIIYIYIYHHHHHVVLPAWISLTLSRHFSLSFIAFGGSSGLHTVSPHSCCMYVRSGRSAFTWPYAGVHSFYGPPHHH